MRHLHWTATSCPQWWYQPQWRWSPHRPQCLCAHCRSIDHRSDQGPGGRQEEKTNPFDQIGHGTGQTVHSLCNVYQTTFPQECRFQARAKERPELGFISRAPRRKTSGSQPAGTTGTVLAKLTRLVSCLRKTKLSFFPPLLTKTPRKIS